MPLPVGLTPDVAAAEDIIGPASARDGELFGMLREAATGEGNFGMGIGTQEEAANLGEAWIGPS